jgi:cyclase
MLKKRVIATLVVKDNIVVQSFNFNKYLPVGKPEIAVEFLNQWGVDEIVYLDISATKNNLEPNFQLIKKVAKKCFVPLIIGGGIKTIDHVKELMQSGADKISLNSTIIHNQNFAEEASTIFGNQCIVASIDAIKVGNKYEIFDYLNNRSTNLEVGDFVTKLEVNGIGEIIINSVDRDGSYKGFDLDLINNVCNNTNVPVICSGGAKTPRHFLEVFQNTNVSGASAANYFHFYEHSVTIAKSFINTAVPLRMESKINYRENRFFDDFRLLKKNDLELEKMLFTKIEKEII